MPPSRLLAEASALDKAVMKLYGYRKDMAEAEMVADLMGRYQRLAEK